MFVFLDIDDQHRLFAVDLSDPHGTIPELYPEDGDAEVSILRYQSLLSPSIPPGEVASDPTGQNLIEHLGMPEEGEIWTGSASGGQFDRLFPDSVVPKNVSSFRFVLQSTCPSLGVRPIDLPSPDGFLVPLDDTSALLRSRRDGFVYRVRADGLEHLSAFDQVRADSGVRLSDGRLILVRGDSSATVGSLEGPFETFDFESTESSAGSWVVAIDDHRVGYLTSAGQVMVFDANDKSRVTLGRDALIDIQGDTKTWSRGLATDGEALYTVYGNRSEVIRYGLDGSAPTSSQPSAESLTTIAYLPGLGVAVVSGTTGRVWLSDDGFAWSPLSTGGEITGFGFGACTLEPLSGIRGDPGFILAGAPGEGLTYTRSSGYCEKVKALFGTPHQMRAVGSGFVFVATDEGQASFVVPEP